MGGQDAAPSSRGSRRARQPRRPAGWGSLSSKLPLSGGKRSKAAARQIELEERDDAAGGWEVTLNTGQGHRGEATFDMVSGNVVSNGLTSQMTG